MRTNKKFVLGIASTVAVIAIPVTTAIACGSKEKESHHRRGRGKADPNASEKLISQEERNKRIKEIKKYEALIAKADDDKEKVIDSKKINLVSLGDSVASGFTLLEGLSDKHRGFYDPNTKKVSGISYGSYLARAFQEQNILGDFNNFAIAGSTTETLLNVVDPTYKLSKKGEAKKIELGFIVSPEEKERFKKAQKKIKEANLITISIGANDILGRLKLGGLSIMELMTNPQGLDFSKGLDNLIDFGSEEKMKEIIQGARLNLLHTIAKIKEVNPTAKIALVGYPMPVAQLGPLLQLVETTDEDGVTQSVANKLLGMLASVSSSISSKFKTIDFIDANVPEEWRGKALSLAPKLMDIHPGPKGYREMAGTILANLTGSSKLHSQIPNNGDIEKRLNKNYKDIILKYIEKDKNNNFKATPLGKEAKAVQDKATPEELLMVASKMIDGIVGSLLNSNSPAPSATDSTDNLYNNYTMDIGSMLIKLQKVEPLFISLLKSAEAGIQNKDKEISEASDQNVKYLFAKITDSIVKYVGAQGEDIQNGAKLLIGDLSKASIPTAKAILKFAFRHAKDYIDNEAGLSSLKTWLYQEDKDGKVLKEVLNKGAIIPKKYQ
ncbi:GDSL-type esterase/lipase family protein [Mycoplasma todarodis]|uniref:GDSL-type esterase/lipase family protein n=1 Tax=Mycoplasma todarodis TaxID=1937191 RepID=UPI003B3316D4